MELTKPASWQVAGYRNGRLFGSGLFGLSYNRGGLRPPLFLSLTSPIYADVFTRSET